MDNLVYLKFIILICTGDDDSYSKNIHFDYEGYYTKTEDDYDSK